MKTCTKCGETKPLDEYHKKKCGKFGREARCKSCVKAYQAEWYERPEVKARKAEYNAYHGARHDVKARKAEYSAEYNATNPHVSWVAAYRLRAKKYGYPVVIEPFTKDELIARWGDACWHCGGPFEELDHAVIPVALGGHHTLENCRPSCLTCNRAGANVRRTNTTTEKSN